MIHLNLPQFKYKVKSEDGKFLIFDEIRKKYVALTPEESVRQHMLSFLVYEKKYPISLIAVESAIIVNKLLRRCDIVLYNNSGRPVMIVECKAPTIKISQDTFNQIAAYNLKLKVDLLVVSNGLQHYCCSMDYINSSWQFLKEIPDYSGIV